MKTEILHKKLSRYLDGQSMPAEANQIQNWLSIVDKKSLGMSEEDKAILENEILNDIRAYTAYPLFFPPKKSIWQKFSELF
jgi:hypothetical protein